MFKCPYCQQDSYAKSSRSRNTGKFGSWQAVQKHSSKCKINTGEYFIDNNFGPLHIEIIRSKTKLELSNLNLASNINDIKRSFKNRKLNPGSYQKTYSKEELISCIQDFVKTYNRIPQAIELTKKIAYPCWTTFRTYFGSFNEAIKAAGFEPDYNDGLGIRTVAKDNVLYRSKAEAYFVDNYLYGKYIYEYERKYDNHNKYYDFYLPDLELYIELDGGLRPQVIEEKILINKQENKNLLVIPISKIYNKIKLTEFL